MGTTYLLVIDPILVSRNARRRHSLPAVQRNKDPIMAHRGIGCQSRGVDGVESIHRRQGTWYKNIQRPE
jgi:hypothetical protein